MRPTLIEQAVTLRCATLPRIGAHYDATEPLRGDAGTVTLARLAAARLVRDQRDWRRRQALATIAAACAVLALGAALWIGCETAVRSVATVTARALGE